MNDKNILDYSDIYAAFIRIKDSRLKEDYIVPQVGKEEGEQDGRDSKTYN